MRFSISILLLALFLNSCGSDPVAVQRKSDTFVQSLELPLVYAGANVDTSFPALRIYAVKDTIGDVTDLKVEVDFPADSTCDTVNVFVDQLVRCELVDSIIDKYCYGKDLRLIGENSGVQLAIPFHTHHRFLQQRDTVALNKPQVHGIHIRITGQEADDSVRNNEEMKHFFTAFYGNAWVPHDSLLFPQRQPHRQDISTFTLEGQAWDETNIKASPDSASMLAAYNEFVNRMEIFQKMGTFYVMHLGFIDLQYDEPIVWGDLMRVCSLHYQVQDSLRKNAQQYLYDKIMNEGMTNILYEFTDEDLLMLYPDRLRWNGRMSGPTENRYDAMHLATFKIAVPPPPAKLPPQQVPLD